jgi:hypothetical protein
MASAVCRVKSLGPPGQGRSGAGARDISDRQCCSRRSRPESSNKNHRPCRGGPKDAMGSGEEIATSSLHLTIECRDAPAERAGSRPSRAPLKQPKAVLEQAHLAGGPGVRIQLSVLSAHLKTLQIRPFSAREQKGFCPRFCPRREGQRTREGDVLQVNRRDPKKSFVRTVAQRRPAGWLTRGEGNVEAICSARGERTFTPGMASNWFAPKAYLHRANEPAPPDAVAPGAGTTARW